MRFTKTIDEIRHSTRPLAMGVPLVLMGSMWLILVVATVWAWFNVHAGGAVPVHGGGAGVQVSLDPAGMSRVIQKVQTIGLISIGVLAVLILVGLSVGEKQERE
jgi:hypothetical protein